MPTWHSMQLSSNPGRYACSLGIGWTWIPPWNPGCCDGDLTPGPFSIPIQEPYTGRERYICKPHKTAHTFGADYKEGGDHAPHLTGLLPVTPPFPDCSPLGVTLLNMAHGPSELLWLLGARGQPVDSSLMPSVTPSH
jgi:hypothetical protein